MTDLKNRKERHELTESPFNEQGIKVNVDQALSVWDIAAEDWLLEQECFSPGLLICSKQRAQFLVNGRRIELVISSDDDESRSLEILTPLYGRLLAPYVREELTYYLETNLLWKVRKYLEAGKVI